MSYDEINACSMEGTVGTECWGMGQGTGKTYHLAHASKQPA